MKHPTPARIAPKCLVMIARSLAKPDGETALHTELLTNDRNIDICLVSETWLTDKIPSHLVCPERCIIIRKDRTDARTGGGVAVLCRDD